MTTALSRYNYLTDPFHDDSLDSYEGVPDFAPSRKAQAGPGARAHDALAWAGNVLPGIALAFVLAWAGYALSELFGQWMKYQPGKSPLSPITVAVLLGLVIRNTVGVPKAYEAGLRLCLKTALRLGIVILGFTLSMEAIGHDVVAGLPVIFGCIAAALIGVTLVNRALGLPRRLGTLI